jgi:hypothetical protein
VIHVLQTYVKHVMEIVHMVATIVALDKEAKITSPNNTTTLTPA